jgi:ABC-type multidrug transport system fused ATPase/permease subunit
MAMFKRLMIKLVPHWPWVAASTASVLVVMALNLAVPQLFRIGIDTAILGGRAFYLPWLALAVVLVTLVKGVFSFLQRYAMERVAQRVIYEMRGSLYRHLLEMSFSFYEKTQTGQLMSRATADVEMLKRFYGFGIVHLFQGILTFAGVIVVIFTMHWQLSLITVATLPFITLAIIRFGRLVGPAYQIIQEELAELTSVLQENLSGIRVVKAFSREDSEKEKFDRNNRRLLAKNLAAVRVFAYYFPFIGFLTGLSAAVILWYGGREVIRGNLLLGELVAFNSYLLMLVMPMRMLGWVVNLAQRGLASASRVFELLDAEPEVRDLPGAREITRVQGEVVFENVSFSYREGVEALRGISFTAAAGQKIAIVGTTGSGKTTLVNLIPRFYDPTGGRILLDGIDIREFTLHSLRENVGFVPQETFLFSASIYENIGYGNPRAGPEEIAAAARAAQIHDFIETLPRGYQTVVGERGIGLSGGQRQRIAVARALLKDPKVLILDDYTSNVDHNTEYLIRQALATLMRGRTSFIIAQRVATVQSADLILVLDGGEVAVRGTHGELLAGSNLYAKICELQFRGESCGGGAPWTT